MFRGLTYVLSVVALGGASASVAQQGYGGVHNKALDTLPPAFLTAASSKPYRDDGPYVLLRIEYPAAISQSGINELARQKLASPITKQFNHITQEYIEARILDGVNKSTFYAAKLYRYLRDSGDFPPGTVVLQPVYLDGPKVAGEVLATQRLNAMVPAVATLQFSAVRAFDGDISMRTPADQEYNLQIRYNSFGDILASGMQLMTEPTAWPVSRGMIMRAWPTLAPKVIPVQPCQSPDCTRAGADIGDMIGGARLAAFELGVSGEKAKSLAYPTSTNFPNTVTTCDATRGVLAPPCSYEVFTRNVLRIAFTQIDPYLATRYQWRDYIKRYDSKLASYWPGGVLAPELATAAAPQLQMIRQIMKGERLFLSRLSDQLAAQALEGEGGKAMRAQLVAERDFSRAVQSASRPRFDLGAMMGVAQAFAGISGSIRGGDLSAQIAATSIARDREIANSERRSSALVTLGSAYEQVSRTFASGMKVTIDPGLVPGLGQGESSLEVLQGRLIALYQSAKFPPLPSPAGSCQTVYAPPEYRTSFVGICKLKDGHMYGEYGNGVIASAQNGVPMSTFETAENFSVIYNNFSKKGGLPIVSYKYSSEADQFPFALILSVTKRGADIYKIIAEEVSYGVTENGKTRSAAKVEQEFIDQEILKARQVTQALIAHATVAINGK